MYAHKLIVMNKVEEGLYNFKLSVKNSIRKAPTVFSHVHLMMQLKSYGVDDWTSVTRKWNGMTVSAHKVAGSRAVCLKLLITQCPSSVLDKIMDHVVEHGSSAVWGEDALGSKKLYPGNQFSSPKSKKWLPRIRVTEESMALMVNRIHADFEKTPVAIRKKLARTAVEEIAEVAAAVWHLGQELQLLAPVRAEVVKDKWLNAWASGSDRIQSEVKVALMDKSDLFSPKDLLTLKDIVDEHVFAAAPIGSNPATLAPIVRDEFDFILKQIRYDDKVHHVWTEKLKTFESTCHHAVNDWRLENHNKAHQNTLAFMDTCVKLTTWEATIDDQLRNLVAYKRDLGRRLGCQASDITCACIMNAIAPSMIYQKNMEKMIQVISWALGDHSQSIAIVLMPQFAYQRGKVYVAEKELLEQLMKTGENIDLTWSVLFKDPCDIRDQRPMSYSGRFVFPSHLDVSKSYYWNSALRKLRRTNEVSQLSPKDMRELSDLSDDALPRTTDLNDSIKGAMKYAQLGIPAHDEIFRCLFADAELPLGGATLIVDLNMLVGEALQSFISFRANQKHSFFYYGFANSEMEVQSINAFAVEDTVERLLTTSFLLPGHEQIPQTMPEDLKATPPPPPTLNICVLGGPDKKQLQVPAEVQKKWSSVDQCAQEFAQVMEEFRLKHGLAIAVDPATETPTKKRKGTTEGGTPVKVAKVEDGKLITQEEMQGALLWEVKVPVANKTTGVVFQIREGNTRYVVNAGQEAIDVPAFTPLVGFGKGNFKLLKGTTACANTDIEFELKNDTDLVVFNNNVMTVSELVQELKKAAAVVEITYHKTIDENQESSNYSKRIELSSLLPVVRQVEGRKRV